MDSKGGANMEYGLGRNTLGEDVAVAGSFSFWKVRFLVRASRKNRPAHGKCRAMSVSLSSV